MVGGGDDEDDDVDGGGGKAVCVDDVGGGSELEDDGIGCGEGDELAVDEDGEEDYKFAKKAVSAPKSFYTSDDDIAGSLAVVKLNDDGEITELKVIARADENGETSIVVNKKGGITLPSGLAADRFGGEDRDRS